MSERAVFSPIVASALVFFLALFIAIRTVIGANDFLHELNLPKSVMEEERPAPPVSKPCTPRSDRVVLFVIDGLRLDVSYGMESLNRLRSLGIDASAETHYPSISRPNYVSLVTSVPPKISGVRMNFFNRRLKLDTLMDRLREGGRTSAYMADRSPALPEIFRRNLDGKPFEKPTFDTAYFAPWAGAFVELGPHILRERHAFIFFLPGRVDMAGHNFGAATPEYRQAATDVDQELIQYLNYFDFEKETIIITADHGHTDAGGHGGVEPEVMRVPLVMAGAGIKPRASLVDASLIDVPVTAACLLGVAPPRDGFGYTLVDALDMPTQEARAIYAADKQRVEHNASYLETRLDEESKELANKTRNRLIISVCLIVLGIAVAYGGTRAGALLVDWKLIGIAIIAFPLAYYSLLALLGQNLSPSVIPSSGFLVGILVKYGIAATGVSVVVTWFALRKRVVLADRLAAANGLIIAGLTVASIPALAMWALFPEPYYFVPAPDYFLLLPATFVAVFCFALACSMTIVVEVIVFFARAIDPRAQLAQARRSARIARRRITQLEERASDDSEE